MPVFLALSLAACSTARRTDDPARGYRYHVRAIERLKMLDYESALECMDSAVTLDPDNIYGWINKGLIEIRADRPVEEPHASFSEAIRRIEKIRFRDVREGERSYYGRVYLYRSRLNRMPGDSAAAVADSIKAEKYRYETRLGAGANLRSPRRFSCSS